MNARPRIAFALLWLAALLLAGWWISAHLQLTGDLRKFMPAPETPEQKLLIDELGEGPGSRLLLVALSGADAPTLAAQSKALRAAFAGDEQFTLVANGDAGLDAIPRSEEHTSELQSLMRISYAVFCLKNKNSQSQHYLNCI